MEAKEWLGQEVEVPAWKLGVMGDDRELERWYSEVELVPDEANFLGP